MHESEIESYLARIGAARPERADPAALHDLQLRHLNAVPFENLSIHLGEDIRLSADALVDKVVRRRRGGFCYELNGAFAALLSALGYPTTLLAARVAGPDGLSPPFDHLAIRVDLDEPWLVDAGFGAFSHYPLRLDVRTDQPDAGGMFTIVETAEGDLDIFKDTELEYRLEPRPRRLADFIPTCWYHRTSPDSHFTRSLICSRLTEKGRVSLSGRLLIESINGQREERVPADDDEVLATYQREFGITLEHLPPEPVHNA